MSDELVALANDACYGLRKSWGMHGQISVGFLSIDADAVTLKVSTSSARWLGFDLPETVRNTLVRFFRDLLPVPIARIIYTNQVDGVEEGVRFLPFYSEALAASEPPTAPLILIEGVCEQSREENRGAFEAAWKEVS
jgi:hypothetical protein